MIRGGGSTLALGGPQELRKRDPAVMEWEFAIFVNGRKLNDYRSPEKVRFLRVPSPKQVMTLATEGEEVVLGPLDGAIDLLRISEGVRYGRDFGPPTEAWATDANTRALFLFDGSLRGSSAFSSESIEAR